ncbi:TPA: hypothetical protein I7732_21940, partial [Vibrio vulnificus]|nr:hypothetical protein [Vibrio vulnificus]
ISAGPFLNMAGEEPCSNIRRTPRGSTSVSKLYLKPKRRKPAKKQAFLMWSVKSHILTSGEPHEVQHQQANFI